MTIVKAVRVYNEALEKEEVEVIFEKNGREYWGALFWENSEWNKILEVLETAEVDDKYERHEVLNCVQKYIELSVKYGGDVYKDTLATMLHWQHVNRFSKEIF